MAMSNPFKFLADFFNNSPAGNGVRPDPVRLADFPRHTSTNSPAAPLLQLVDDAVQARNALLDDFAEAILHRQKEYSEESAIREDLQALRQQLGAQIAGLPETIVKLYKTPGQQDVGDTIRSLLETSAQAKAKVREIGELAGRESQTVQQLAETLKARLAEAAAELSAEAFRLRLAELDKAVTALDQRNRQTDELQMRAAALEAESKALHEWKKLAELDIAQYRLIHEEKTACFERNRELEKQVAALDAKIAAEAGQAQRFETELADKNARLICLEEENEVGKKEKQALKGEILMHEERQRKLDNELAARQQRLDVVERERSEFEQDKLRLEGELGTCRGEVADLQQAIQSFEATVASLNEELDRYKKESLLLCPSFLASDSDFLSPRNSSDWVRTCALALRSALYPLRKYEDFPDRVDAASPAFRAQLQHLGAVLNDYLRATECPENDIEKIMLEWIQAINAIARPQNGNQSVFTLFAPRIGSAIDTTKCNAPQGVHHVSGILNWGIIDVNGNYQIRAMVK